MSGWIRVEKSLLSDIRFTRMVRQYCAESNALRNAGITAMLGALTQLWLYADEHIHDDDTLRASVEDINELVGINHFCRIVPGDWLVVLDPEQIKLPNFLAHNGTCAKVRKQNAIRQNTYRWKKNNALRNDSNALPNGSNAPIPDQTRPYKTQSASKVTLPGKDPEAPIEIFRELCRTGGTEPARTDRLQRAIDAVGGMTAIRSRTEFTTPKIEKAFCEAYRS
jgi:hypothetical protein